MARTEPQPPAVPPPVKPRSAKQWFYEDGFDIVGPVPEAELRTAAENDLLFPDARVWSQGMPDWRVVIEVFPRLFDGLRTKPGRDKQTRLATILAVSAVVSLLLFGLVYAIKGMGKSEEPAKQDVAKNDAPAPTSAPAAPAPEPDAKLTPQQIMAKCGPSVVRVSAGNGTGSGFLVRPNVVVTNAHVVEGALTAELKVLFPSGSKPEERLPATLVYEDVARDLAILEIRSDLPPLKLASDVAKGEDVVVIGSPTTAPGKIADNSITRGIVSATNEEVLGQKFHRIDASINPGNSGGPVLNDRGTVLGVATLRLNDKQQMNYIVPFADIAAAVERAKDVPRADVAALAKRHDTQVVTTRYMVALLLNDEVQRAYGRHIVAAQRQKGNPLPGIRAVKSEQLAPTQARVNFLVTSDIRDLARRLTGNGPGAAEGALRDDIRKLLSSFDISQRLVANVEDYTPNGYLDAHDAHTTRLGALIKSLPGNLGESEEQFKQRIGGLLSEVQK